ncbi:hypothetical protein MMC13_003433 [Lambiella insularis]|nr:hypothetical protein [Lambiella insularis]
MEVQLYVYDLSKGLARQISRNFLGTQIDAVYHTSLVFGGIEYFFGAGVQTCYPGSTHHGRPMEIISMGQTQLGLEVILEYLDSLKIIYTAESYDLFLHNCNNFSNDFAMFLVGKGIPSHITSLPQTVLNTPFGQMLKPQLDQAMRGITQTPAPPSSIRQPTTSSNGTTAKHPNYVNSNGAKEPTSRAGMVHNVTRLRELNQLLDSAKSSCAVIFFTSATCPPCKLCYPAYEELAVEAGSKAVLIKVDLSQAHEIGSTYQVRATPTFMTFLNGDKMDEWSGANPGKLLGNIRLLIQMAHPPHPHTSLRLPKLQQPHCKPVTYAKVPPLDKMIAKLGASGNASQVSELKHFIATRTSSEAASAPLPQLPEISTFVIESLQTLPSTSLFPLIDLLRLAFVDPRVSGYFAEDDKELVVPSILSRVNILGDDCPYTVRIVTLQFACNLFTSPLFPPQLLGRSSYTDSLIQLVTSSLLDEEHPAVRVSAASLAFNIAAFNHAQRLEQKDQNTLPESAQVELLASILEATGKEGSSKETVKGLVFALGLLAYGCDVGGEVKDVLGALGAKDIVQGRMGLMAGEEALVKEVLQVVV